ncbi:hypothetical protein Trydic_g13557 [Trypoxylus dichotomus]
MYEIDTYLLAKRLLADERSTLLRGQILERNDACLPIGFVLNGYRNVMLSMRNNMFGSWPTLSMNLHNRIRCFMENMEKCEPTLKRQIPLGVRTMDLIDILMGAYYEVCVIYDIPNKFCYITGHYRLGDSRFLSYLPDISFLNDCNDRQLMEEEADILMKYLVLLVNVHNGLLTKSEQYRRDLEFSKSTNDDNSECAYFENYFESKKKSKRGCCSYRKPAYREILDDCGEVLEIYIRAENQVNLVTDNGVRCYVQLQCNIDEAPLQVKRSFSHLKNDIIFANKSVENIDPDIFNNRTSTSSKSYGVSVKLEIRLPYNNPQMIDLKFSDGENLDLT